MPRLRYSSDQADATRLYALVAGALGQDAAGVLGDPAWPAVIRALRDAEADGWDLPQVLAGSARRGSVAAADSPAQLLAWRIGDHVDGRIPPAPLAQPTEQDAARYAALLGPKLAPGAALDPIEATRPPQLLNTDPAAGATDHQRLLALILGDNQATHVAAEPAWPALRTAIRLGEVPDSVDPVSRAKGLVAVSQGLMVVGKANPDEEVLRAIVDSAFIGLS